MIPSHVVAAQCTESWDVEEINILGVMHHAHLVGYLILQTSVFGNLFSVFFSFFPMFSKQSRGFVAFLRLPFG